MQKFSQTEQTYNLDIGVPIARILLFLSDIAYLHHPDKRTLNAAKLNDRRVMRH